MAKIHSDWHIHTESSCDDACMTIENLVADAKKLGISDYGVSDHLHTVLQECDIADSRRKFNRTLALHPELQGHFHFGVEASVMSQWECNKIAKGDYTEIPIYGIRDGGPANAAPIILVDDEFIEKYGIEYVISGVHWTLYCEKTPQAIVKDYFRQYLYAASYPHTDILAHFCWWNPIPAMQNPFADFSVITESMRSELKAALIENNTALEINICAMLQNEDGFYPASFIDEYLGWMAEMQRSGVVLSLGSDCHSPDLYSKFYTETEKLFDHYGIDTSKFFTL